MKWFCVSWIHPLSIGPTLRCFCTPLEPLWGLLRYDLFNVLALTHTDPLCDHFSSDGVNVNLSLSQVWFKLPSISHNSDLVYFELLIKSRDPKVLVYPLTCPLNQTLLLGWIGGVLNDNPYIFHGNKSMWLGEEWIHSLLPISNNSCSTPSSFLPLHTAW